MPECRAVISRIFGLGMALVLFALSVATPCVQAASESSFAFQEPSMTPGTQIVVFNVYSEHSGIRLDRQAVVKLVRLADQSATWQTTEATSRSIFSNVIYGGYEVEVSAVGYFTLRQQLTVMRMPGSMELEILMHRDPAAMDLDVARTIMSPKARKEAKRAISYLKSGDLDLGAKHLDAAYKLTPTSAEVNFLLGYVQFQRKDFEKAGTYLDMAANLNPTNGQTLTLLGRTRLEQRQYSEGSSILERAVLADPENWISHQLLATAYFHGKNYDKAYSEAETALKKSEKLGIKSVASVQLVLGQSLAGLGRDEEAIKTLNIFLQDSASNPMAAQVRALIGEIQNQPSSASEQGPLVSQAKFSDLDPLKALPSPALLPDSWRSPSIDDLKPILAQGVTCPTETVIKETGKRVHELVDDLAKFAAVEDLLHQSLDRFGIPIRTQSRKFDYVASLSEAQPGEVYVEEYRSSRYAAADSPDQIASSGFASFALVFHPEMRKDFDLNCEGLTDWHGAASWLVDFRQRDDRPNRMQSYQIGAKTFPVDLRGRAWITADTFQIVRMEADLVKPISEIRLISEHQIVEYGPVPFPKRSTTLWLPKQAEIYFSFRKHNYYRRHSFDHYMLFSVDTEEKRKDPVRGELAPGASTTNR